MRAPFMNNFTVMTTEIKPPKNPISPQAGIAFWRGCDVWANRKNTMNAIEKNQRLH